jgi:chromate transporter
MIWDAATLETAWRFFIEFLQVSLLAFGGGTAALPEMHRVVVEEQAWASEAQFSEMFGLAQASPGPNILVASLIGWKVAEFPGALAGLVGVLGPASLLSYFVNRAWDHRPHERWRELVLAALVPITIGLTLSSGYLVTLGAAQTVGTSILIAAAAAAFFWTRVHPLWWIGIGAALGYMGLV